MFLGWESSRFWVGSSVDLACLYHQLLLYLGEALWLTVLRVFGNELLFLNLWSFLTDRRWLRVWVVFITHPFVTLLTTCSCLYLENLGGCGYSVCCSLLFICFLVLCNWRGLSLRVDSCLLSVWMLLMEIVVVNVLVVPFPSATPFSPYSHHISSSRCQDFRLDLDLYEAGARVSSSCHNSQYSVKPVDLQCSICFCYLL